MSVSVTRAALAELNEQYIKFLPTIQKLEIQLKQGVKELNFTENDFIFALEYIEDQVTIFRFLKDTDFDEEKAYQRIMDTILWRKEIDIGNITWETVHPNLFKSTENAFSFFYEQDLLGRPIAIIRMRHFPNFGNEKLYDVFPPFACLVMEMARKWTLDLTRQNELELKQQQQSDIDIDDGDNNHMSSYPSVLVSQITVIIDIAKAPMIPLEKKLIQELLNIMDGRFPGFFGSIYMMNFGWMYQGIWQMVKIMLSEKAKSKVNFPSLQEVEQYISEDRLLKELGGLNDYEWSLENDIILKKYGCGWKPPLPPVMSPDLSPVTRPSRSPSVSSFSSVEFYDALETQPLQQQQQPKLLLSDHSGLSSFYGTPGSLTPISTYTPSKIPRSLVPLTSVSSSSPSSSSTSQYFLTGLHIPSFLSSIFSNTSSSSSTLLNINNMSRPVSGLDLTYRLNTLALEQQIKEDNLNNIDDNNEIEGLIIVNQEQQQRFIGQRRPHFPHLLPPDDPHSLYASSPLKMQLRRSEQRIIRFTRRLFRLSFAYNGTIYWILLYIFLRGPLENNIKKILTKMMINPRTITYTTVGLTASVAAGLSISLSNSLNH